jgi:hypothetical protein
MNMNKLEAAAQNRQRILDYLNRGNRASSARIASALGMRTEAVTRLVLAMLRLGEVERNGPSRDCTYSALVETTAPAASVREHARRAENEKPARPKGGKGRYIHVPGNPIPNQGGQGAVRRTVSIQSGMA